MGQLFDFHGFLLNMALVFDGVHFFLLFRLLTLDDRVLVLISGNVELSSLLDVVGTRLLQ